MKVECTECHAKYDIADDRVLGRRVRLRCKHCQATLLIDGRVSPAAVTCERGSIPSGSEPPPNSAQPVGKTSRTILGGLQAAPGTRTIPPPRRGDRNTRPPGRLGLGEDSARAALAESVAATLNSAGRWRVAITEKDLRWMTVTELREAVRNRLVTAETFVLGQGMSHWETLAGLPSLAEQAGLGRSDKEEDLLSALPPAPAGESRGWQGTAEHHRQPLHSVPINLVPNRSKVAAAAQAGTAGQVPSFLTLAPAVARSATVSGAPAMGSRPTASPGQLGAAAMPPVVPSAPAFEAVAQPTSKAPQLGPKVMVVLLMVVLVLGVILFVLRPG